MCWNTWFPAGSIALVGHRTFGVDCPADRSSLLGGDSWRIFLLLEALSTSWYAKIRDVAWQQSIQKQTVTSPARTERKDAWASLAWFRPTFLRELERPYQCTLQSQCTFGDHQPWQHPTCFSCSWLSWWLCKVLCVSMLVTTMGPISWGAYKVGVTDI